MSTTDETIERLETELYELRRHLTELEMKASRVREDVAAVQRVIALLSGLEPPRNEVSATIPAAIVVRDLRPQPTLPLPFREGLTARRNETQVEWLVRYAREHGGVVTVKEVRPSFVAAGLTRSKPRNIGSHIYHALARSGLFEKVQPGEFQLIGFEPEPDEIEEPEALFQEEPERKPVWAD